MTFVEKSIKQKIFVLLACLIELILADVYYQPILKYVLLCSVQKFLLNDASHDTLCYLMFKARYASA